MALLCPCVAMATLFRGPGIVMVSPRRGPGIATGLLRGCEDEPFPGCRGGKLEFPLGPVEFGFRGDGEPLCLGLGGGLEPGMVDGGRG